MKKQFNITGTCFPDLHYMMDVSKKKAQVMEMVKSGNYFIINRPRQYGKTTMLYLLGMALEEMDGYMPIEMNFQGIDSKWHESDQAFAKMFSEQLIRLLEYQQPKLATFLKEEGNAV
ncbi:MAG: AAA family ATPase, partial [Bacteroidota bacterium]